MTPQELVQAGFSQQEANQYSELQKAGFSDDEIISHFEQSKTNTPVASKTSTITPKEPMGVINTSAAKTITGLLGTPGTLQNLAAQALGVGPKPGQEYGLPTPERIAKFAEEKLGMHNPWTQPKKPGWKGAAEEFIPQVLMTAMTGGGGLLTKGRLLSMLGGDVAGSYLKDVGYPNAGALAELGGAMGPEIARLAKGTLDTGIRVGKAAYDVTHDWTKDAAPRLKSALAPTKSTFKTITPKEFEAQTGNAQQIILDYLPEIELPSRKTGMVDTGVIPHDFGTALDATGQALGKIANKVSTAIKEATGQGITGKTEPILQMYSERLPGAGGEAAKTVKGIATEFSPVKIDPFIEDRIALYKKYPELTPEAMGEIVHSWNTYLSDKVLKSPDFAGKLEFIAAEAKMMRKILRDAVDTAADANPGEFGKLRDQMRDLMTFQDALKERIKSIGAKSKNPDFNPDAIDIYSTGLTVGGLLSQNVSGPAKGATFKLLKDIKNLSQDPDRLLRRSFEAAAKARRYNTPAVGGK